MKSFLTAAALGVALLALPGAAFADTSMSSAHDAMAPAMAPHKAAANDATMLCRPAAAGEKANATAGSKPLICKSLEPMMQHGMMMVPKTTSTADKAWNAWLEHALDVPAAVGGNG
ncbi:MAG TPA: hypothetical protein VGN14_04545 [Candidatus Elarobacter sp.]